MHVGLINKALTVAVKISDVDGKKLGQSEALLERFQKSIGLQERPKQNKRTSYKRCNTSIL